LSGQGYRIHRGAVADLDGAAEWYDAREPGLGLAFVDAVIAGIEAIVARPSAWQRDCLVAGREVRRFVLARFPFSVFYYCEREAVFVVAVAHGKRLPGAWRPRVGDFQ
jgi:toxin ParE1/3/4